MTQRGSIRIEGAVKKHDQLTVLHGIDLDIKAGEFFVLLGPSGSGKTTTLRVLAGLESLSAGKVFMDDEDVTSKEPGERDVAMVFQSYALYPHMSVEENIAFPLKMIGQNQSSRNLAAREAATKVNIEHLMDRKPGQLSGGQQQRVALARAIVRQPRLFLLDEPLSNLDAKLRLETRIELRKLQRSLNVTTVYVTHDQEEAMTLADRVAVFMEGKIVQIDTPRNIFARPATLTVASFIGSPPMNLLAAQWQGSTITFKNGDSLQIAQSTAASREVIFGVRPSDLAPSAEGVSATVELIEDLGDSITVALLIDQQPIKMKLPHTQLIKENETIKVSCQPATVHLFDPLTGQRL
jgi:multiple sugar transport system ATP-binding protein